MVYRKTVKIFAAALAIASLWVGVDVACADDVPHNASNDDTEATITELEQSLLLIKRIEENRRQLVDESTFTNATHSYSTYSQTEEITEQDKLIADMAKRMNDSAGLSNQDGSITISGYCLNHQDKLILKGFVESIREQLIKVTGVKFPSSAYRVLVIGVVPKEKQANVREAQYKINIVPDAMPHQDAATIRITILNPQAMDSHEFAECVIRGYLALYSYVLRKSNYSGESIELPNWFIKGLGRQIDFQSRQKDINLVLFMWSNGLIPPVEKLVSASSNILNNNPVLASALVGFWLDCKDSQKRFRSLMTELANGTQWTAELFKRTILDEISFLELDYGLDSWLLAQRFKVLEVGSSSENLARRIVTNLMLIPGYGIVPEEVGMRWVAQSPAELAKYASEPWAKKLAQRKQQFMIIASTGRNDEFRAAAAEIIAFYQAVIDGKGTEQELRQQYVSAEEKLFKAVSEEE